MNDKNNNIYKSEKTKIFTVSPKSNDINKKKLICFSVINNEICNYGNNCVYAHSYKEQIIDYEKKIIYQIIFDKNLMNFFSQDNKIDEIYNKLLFYTNICNNCMIKKCTGGYNCRNGACETFLKLCKNDLLTGECHNNLVNINIENFFLDKLEDPNFESNKIYKGCINGHHLTERKLLPYYKYIHQKDSHVKNKYQSVRYIDINSFKKYLKEHYDTYSENILNDKLDSESSTDEEINNWFKKNSDSDE